MTSPTGRPVMIAGADLGQARAALIMLHGRGSTAEDILSLSDRLGLDRIAYLAPQAQGGAWYPYVYSEPVERNEPYLTSALEVIHTLVGQAQTAGLPFERIGLLGFSQGACLALEYAARHSQRLAGVFGLSGALVGGQSQARSLEVSLDGTPVLLGCSDSDPYIALEDVEAAAEHFARIGATVDKRIYAGLDHTVNEDEMSAVRAVLESVIGPK